MLAVNTLPNPSTLTASTTPVAADSRSIRITNGSRDIQRQEDMGRLPLETEIGFQPEHADASGRAGLANEGARAEFGHGSGQRQLRAGLPFDAELGLAADPAGTAAVARAQQVPRHVVDAIA